MNDNSLIAEIEGYAAIYDEPDLNGDVIAPGAFAKTLHERAAPVRMLYQHTAETPIGRWTGFRETAKGLIAKGEILLSSARGYEAFALLEGGALDGLSIGYRTKRARKTCGENFSERGGRRIVEADLWEVSIVTFPMAQRARIFRVSAPKAEHSLSLRAPAHRAAQARRASGLPPLDARHFAHALTEAASILSVQGVHE